MSEDRCPDSVMEGYHSKASRAVLRWSRADLGRRVGCDQQTIAAFEKGKGNIRHSLWRAIDRTLRQTGIQFKVGGITWPESLERPARRRTKAAEAENDE